MMYHFFNGQKTLKARKLTKNTYSRNMTINIYNERECRKVVKPQSPQTINKNIQNDVYIYKMWDKREQRRNK